MIPLDDRDVFRKRTCGNCKHGREHEHYRFYPCNECAYEAYKNDNDHWEPWEPRDE